jgi:hypothetical protein
VYSIFIVEFRNISSMSKFSDYPFWDLYQENDWYRKMVSYLNNRVFAITQRLSYTTRFLDVDERNKNGFSYEHASARAAFP